MSAFLGSSRWIVVALLAVALGLGGAGLALALVNRVAPAGPDRIEALRDVRGFSIAINDLGPHLGSRFGGRVDLGPHGRVGTGPGRHFEFGPGARARIQLAPFHRGSVVVAVGEVTAVSDGSVSVHTTLDNDIVVVIDDDTIADDVAVGDTVAIVAQRVDDELHARRVTRIENPGASKGSV